MRKLFILTLALVTLVIACSSKPVSPLEPPFNQVIPACQSDMQTTYETTDRGKYYSERGAVHHQRNCTLDNVRLRISIEVFDTELMAKAHIDDLVADVSTNGGALTGEVMLPSSVKLYITEPAWIETPVRLLYPGEDPGERITFRVGRYVGSAEVQQDFFVEYEYERLMYQMADGLVASLHQLAVDEGVVPALSQEEAIQAVIDHIENGEPIVYPTQEAAIDEPPGCGDDDTSLDEVDIYLADKFNLWEVLAAAGFNPDDFNEDEFNADDFYIDAAEYGERCFNQPFEAWKALGQPMVDYTWNEDRECWEWDRSYSINSLVRQELSKRGIELPDTLDFNRFPWEAEFYGPEDDLVRQNRAEVEKISPQDAESLLRDPTFARGFLWQTASSVPHWMVTGLAERGDHGCWWIVHEIEGVVYASAQ